MDTPLDFERLRRKMVAEQITGRGITTPALIKAFLETPRELFVPPHLQQLAYADQALPITPGVTISQPYIVALMIEELNLQPGDRVLEVGTGSGYAVAIMSKLCKWIYSVDIDPQRLEQAQRTLQELAVNNCTLEVRDGFNGWRQHAPFDKITVAAAPTEVPRELVAELAIGGSMVLPLGDEVQELLRIEKQPDGLKIEEIGGVRFVPMRRTRDEEQ